MNNDKVYIRKEPRLSHVAYAFCLTIFLKQGMKKISKMQIDRYFDSQTILPLCRLFLQDMRFSLETANVHTFFYLCLGACDVNRFAFKKNIKSIVD